MLFYRHRPGILIAFPSESLSASARNRYRLRPGIAIGIERNMHVVQVLAAAHSHPLRQLAIVLQIGHRSMRRRIRIQRRLGRRRLPLHRFAQKRFGRLDIPSDCGIFSGARLLLNEPEATAPVSHRR